MKLRRQWAACIAAVAARRARRRVRERQLVVEQHRQGRIDDHATATPDASAALGTREEGERQPDHRRPAQPRVRSGDVPRVPPGRGGRGQVHQRLQGRHRRPPGPARELRDRRPAVDLGPLRRPDRRQEAGLHPRRRRHRRARRVRGLEARGPRRRRRHPVHAGREQRAATPSMFISVSIADNAAASKYAVEKLGVKKASVIYTDDTQGKFTGLAVIARVLKAQGVEVKTVPIAPERGGLLVGGRVGDRELAGHGLRQLAERVPGRAEGAQVGRQHGEDLRHRPVHVAAGAQDRR